MTYQEYEQEVQRHLTDRRFYHSQCVAREAARLAQRYGADMEKARLCGILHDIMKDTPPEEQLKILEDSGIILTKTAVACHTSGKGDMTLLEKVLFVADYISADRDYPGVEGLRRVADRSLEEAMVEGILFTVNELMEQRLPVAAESIAAYNDAIFTLEEKKEQLL